MKDLRQLISIHRSGYMLRLDFKDDKQNTQSLHIQSHWRFIKQGKIFVGSFDFSRLFDEDKKDKWGNTLADIFLQELESSLPLNVSSIKLGAFGDMQIVLDDGLVFECFIDTSSKTLECWRWIDTSFNPPKHIVFNED